MHPSQRLVLLLTALLALAGCGSMPLTPLAPAASGVQGEVLVYREYSPLSAGVYLAVGVGEGAFAYIRNKEQVRVMLPAGQQPMFVRSRNGASTHLAVNVVPHGRVCLKAAISGGTVALGLVPLLALATGPRFNLDQVPCPADAELAQYEIMPVERQ